MKISEKYFLEKYFFQKKKKSQNLKKKYFFENLKISKKKILKISKKIFFWKSQNLEKKYFFEINYNKIVGLYMTWSARYSMCGCTYDWNPSGYDTLTFDWSKLIILSIVICKINIYIYSK